MVQYHQNSRDENGAAATSRATSEGVKNVFEGDKSTIYPLVSV